MNELMTMNRPEDAPDWCLGVCRVVVAPGPWGIQRWLVTPLPLSWAEEVAVKRLAVSHQHQEAWLELVGLMRRAGSPSPEQVMGLMRRGLRGWAGKPLAMGALEHALEVLALMETVVAVAGETGPWVPVQIVDAERGRGARRLSEERAPEQLQPDRLVRLHWTRIPLLVRTKLVGPE